MGVSGEFRYLGPDFSSAARVRPVKAITFPASLEMGNITRLRNLEYMEAGVGRWSLFVGPSVVGSCDPSVRDGDARESSCFHENKPLSRRTSSVNSCFRRS